VIWLNPYPDTNQNVMAEVVPLGIQCDVAKDKEAAENTCLLLRGLKPLTRRGWLSQRWKRCATQNRSFSAATKAGRIFRITVWLKPYPDTNRNLVVVRSKAAYFCSASRTGRTGLRVLLCFVRQQHLFDDLG